MPAPIPGSSEQVAVQWQYVLCTGVPGHLQWKPPKPSTHPPPPPSISHPLAHPPTLDFFFHPKAFFYFLHPIASSRLLLLSHPSAFASARRCQLHPFTMIIDGEKYACEACVRGHRVSNCQHSGKRQTPRPLLPAHHPRPTDRLATTTSSTALFSELYRHQLTPLSSRPSSPTHQQKGPPRLPMRPLPLHAQVPRRSHQVRLRRKDEQVRSSAAYRRRTHW